MPSSTQSRKHSLGLAGEFLVAGELLRRGIMAAVTYGNAKKADVIAVNGPRALAVEVKSTSEAKWVLGNSLPELDQRIWVLVHLPHEDAEPPQYYVLAAEELRALVQPRHDQYRRDYRAKHGKDFTSTGVVSIRRETIPAEYLGAWSKVHERIKS